MRIVIFSINFPPLRNPRAFRVGRFVTKLREKWQVLVMTSPVDLPVKKSNDVHRIGIQVKQWSPTRTALKTKAWFRAIHKFVLPDDKVIHQIPFILNYLFRWRQKDDQIITVSHPFSTHLCGYILKRIWKHKWIIDIGDNYAQMPTLDTPDTLLNRTKRKFEKFIIKKSDLIVINNLFIKSYYMTTFGIPEQKMVVIPNENVINFDHLKNLDSKSIRLSFIGNTYPFVREGIREIKLLIRQIINNPDVEIKIQLFGNQFHELTSLANQYPEWVSIDYCENDIQLMGAYSNTDILLNFANIHSPGLPSKLAEYTASGLPIINFINTKQDPGFLYFSGKDLALIHININEPNMEELKKFIINNKGKHKRTETQKNDGFGLTWQEVLCHFNN